MINRKLYIVGLIVIFTNFAQSQDPIAHYTFNGNANNESGNSWHGQLGDGTGTGDPAPQLTTDRFGFENETYLFNSADNNSYIIVSDNTFLNNESELTFSFWVLTNNPTTQKIISKEGGSLDQFDVTVDGTGRMRVNLNNDASGNFLTISNSSNRVENSKYHHIAITMSESSGLFLYIDGVLDSSDDTPNGTYASATNSFFRIAANGNDSPRFDGVIDDIRIYNRILSDIEVAAIYEDEKPPFSFAAFYQLNGDATDFYGLNADGILTGGIVPTTNRYNNASSAYQFDGEDDQIQLNDDFTKGGTISVSLWMRTTASDYLSNYRTIMSDEGVDKQFSLKINNNNIEFAHGDNNYFLLTVPHGGIHDLNYHHMVLTWTTAVASIYIDGVLIGNANGSGTFDSFSIDPLYIGSGNNNSGTPVDFFKGDIDDVQFYNYELNATEVADLYNSTNSTISSFSPLTAKNGATVSILGTGFVGVTDVSFGGTPAVSYNVVSPTSITAVVADGTSGDVSVTTPGGIVSKTGFTFIPAPTISSFNPPSGGNGETITITGTDFDNVSSVSFGGTEASSFSFVSSTIITAVVGAGTSGDISVTTPGGTTSKAGFSFIPAPTISSFSPQNGQVGSNVTIIGTDFSSVAANNDVKFNGISTNVSVASTTGLTVVVPPGATTGRITVTTAGGTATSEIDFTITFEDTISPKITSIERQSPTSNPTNADILVWDITFDELVLNVTSSDFIITGSTATIVSAIDQGSNIYRVTASGGDLSSVDATVILGFNGVQDITDEVGNVLANFTPTGINENTFIIDNTAPILVVISAQIIDEENLLSFTASATDIPERTLTYSLDQTSVDKGMTIAALTGIFSWTPSESQDGTHEVLVTVSDGDLANEKTVTITVNNVNVAPVLGIIGAKNTDELIELSFIVTSADSDIPVQSLSYSLDQPSLDKGMTIETSTGVFSWTPNETQDGSHDVLVTVSDGDLTDEETVTITVSNVNVAPVLGVIGAKNTDELIELLFIVTSSDSDIPVQSLSYSLDQPSLDKGMTIETATGAFNWTPNETQDGTHEVVVTVSDGALDDTDTATITVNNINEAPVLVTIGAKSIDELLELSFIVTAVDADIPVQSFIYSLDQYSLVEGMTINETTGVFSWTPSEAQDGIYEVTVTVSDNSITDSETITITVNNINVPPVLDAITEKTVGVGSELAFTITATDSDIPAQTLSFSLDQPSIDKSMIIDEFTGSFNWTPTNLQDATHDVIVSVSDGISVDDSHFNIIVEVVNISNPLVLSTPDFSSTNQQVTFSVSGGKPPYTTTISHKGILESTFTEVTLTDVTTGNYSFDIIPAMFDALGVEFEVKVLDAINSPETERGVILVSITNADKVTIPFIEYGGDDEDWSLFSVPYELEPANKFISKIFENYPQIDYEYDWRIMRFRGESDNDYLDHNDGQVAVGEAYWFNARELKAVTIGAGQVTAKIPFEKTLTKGWNLIGNPYPIDISWDKVLSDPVNADAVTAGNVGSLQVFEGTLQKVGEVISPFGGGFVFTHETISISIDPRFSISGGRIEANSFKIESQDIDASEWHLPLSLEANASLTEVGGFGMHPDARELNDGYDKMLVPKLTIDHDLFVEHDDYFYPWFATDVVTTASSYTWHFTLTESDNVEKVFLHWNNDLIEQKKASLFLIDYSSNIVIDMKKQGSYMVNFGGDDFRFDILYAQDGTDILPASFIFGEAYPNPTNGSTTFPVVLPKSNTSYQLELTLYDLQGHRIQQLVQGQYPAGVHQFHFNLSSLGLSSGMYLYELRLNDPQYPPIQKKLFIKN